LPPIHDRKTVEDRVCKLFSIGTEDIYSKSKEKVKARALGLLCYRAVTALGYGLMEWARQLGLTQPVIGYALSREEHIANQNHHKLQK